MPLSSTKPWNSAFLVPADIYDPPTSPQGLTSIALPFSCYCSCHLSDLVVHNQHLAELFCFLQVFWAWQRKHYTGRGNREQAQQVSATNKAAAWTRRWRYRQKTGEFEKPSYLWGTGRGRSQILSRRSVCQADDWWKGGGVPGAKPESQRTVWLLTIRLKG